MACSKRDFRDFDDSEGDDAKNQGSYACRHLGQNSHEHT
jgi:hypothetical protein